MLQRMWILYAFMYILYKSLNNVWNVKRIYIGVSIFWNVRRLKRAGWLF
jgi:hypothetical protein